MTDRSKIVGRFTSIFTSVNRREVLNDKDCEEIHVFLFNLEGTFVSFMLIRSLTLIDDDDIELGCVLIYE